MISERSRQTPNSGLTEFFERALSTPDIVRLDLGEPDFATPEDVSEAAVEALRRGHTHYTATAGIPELREAIAADMKSRCGVETDPDREIVVTPGASSALSLAFLAITDPNHEVLIPDPSWPHYEAMVRLAGGEPVRYPLLGRNKFQLDPEDIQRRLSKKTRLILINSPSNPTGAVADQKSLDEIAEIARVNNLVVISDEVYSEITYDGIEYTSIASLPDMQDRVVTVNAFSKTFAMTGWRLGYATGPSKIICEMTKWNMYVNTCASSFAQRAGVKALREKTRLIEDMLGEYQRRRDFMLARLSEIEGLSCVPPRGAFYVFPNMKATGLTSRELALVLIEKGRVSSIPGGSLGIYGEGYLRLSYANSMENLTMAMDRIEKTLSELPPSR